MIPRSAKLLLLFPVLLLEACSGKPAKKPNFIFLIADDIGYGARRDHRG